MMNPTSRPGNDRPMVVKVVAQHSRPHFIENDDRDYRDGKTGGNPDDR